MTVIKLNSVVENSASTAQIRTNSSVNASTNQELPPVLQSAYEEAKTSGQTYAGSVLPEEAWKLFVGGQAHLIDVRTVEERKFVGQVPNTLHIAWQTGPALIKNPRFLRELESKLPKDAVILFLCRSGKRSAAAATAATNAGFIRVFNVREGFEGDLDEYQQRGAVSGWRQRGLPWVQD